MKLLDYVNWTPIPDIETEKQIAVPKGKKKRRDFWLPVILVVASIVSIGATLYYYNKNETLLYNDAYTHLLIARRVVDNITPGFDQLGGSWLPLQHLLMLPFIWNDTLWFTGLAGTIPSMVCYIMATGYLFCTLRRLTKQITTSLLGVTIFLCNPNILYLQTTPLSEVLCAAAFAATAYYLLCWLQSYEQKYLIYTAIATLLATLIRYDSWALFLVVSAIVIIARSLRKQDRAIIIDQIMIFLAIAPLGILFWFIWNARLYGDPIYFQRGPYSSESFQRYFLQRGELPTYHNMVTSFRVYTMNVGQTVGWGLLLCAVLGLILALLVYCRRKECFILAVMLVPFIFYVLTLYLGQSVIYLPGVDSATFFNVRYGAQMAFPVAFLIGWGSAPVYAWLQKSYIKVIFIMICLIGMGAQVYEVNTSGVISLQDGLTGFSCNNPVNPVVVSLAQHYNGGSILVDEFTSVINPQLFGVHFSNIIWEGSGSYWQNALARPTKYANWIVINTSKPDDTILKLFMSNKQKFLTSFRLVASNYYGLQLYYRMGAPPFPTRPIPGSLLSKPHLCRADE